MFCMSMRQTNRKEFMSLIGIVIAVIVVGVLLWLVESYIPMDATIKRILEAIVVIILVLWLLEVFGVLGAVQNVKVVPLR